MTNTGQEQPSAKKSVVVIGGGFAGLECARRLASHHDVRITLIDKNNYHQFQPLLYQVATAILSPGNAAFALRNILQSDSRVAVKMAEVTSVDLMARTAVTADGQRYQGDFLVLAAGSQPNFFGTPGADRYAYPLYSLEDAEKLRSRLLAVLESVDRDPSLVRMGALSFVVVGAGPTGVEISGALGDLTQRIAREVYKSLDWTRARVYLVDMAHAVLSAFSKESQEYAARILKEHGVEVRLGAAVKEVTSSEVVLVDGTSIRTRTVIWAGGLKASPLSEHLGVKLGHGGRLDVQSDFSVKGAPGVYAIGDFANVSGSDGRPLPQLAAVAQQAGRHCARNISALISGESAKPFEYFDKGIMAMIGRNAAVAEVGPHRHELTGPLAFAAWLGVHALLLTSARARIDTFLEWAWDYFGSAHVEPVLDRPGQLNMDWSAGEK
jgi:NADH dehydrogenase